MISMYRIGDHTLLAGSMHFLPERVDIPGELLAALESKGALVLEANIEECDSSLRHLQEGTLGDFVSEECHHRVLATLEDLGLKAEEIETLKPWACTLNLQIAKLERAGFSYQKGVDEQLRSLAAEEGKPVHVLEPADTVLSIYDAMPLEQQQQFLEKTLDELNKVPEMMTKMLSAWQSGDDRAIERLTERMPFGRFLLSLRNGDWAKGIAKGLTNAPDALVLVGAAHLVGPGNLVRMLRNSGITVSRL